MKPMVYETDIDSEDDFVARIVSAAAEIRETPWHIWKGKKKYAKSMHCLDVNGRVFQHL